MPPLTLRFAPEAIGQLEAADAWWRANREKAPALLATEFSEAVELLRESPGVGAGYPNTALPAAKRYLLRRTRFHIYYLVLHEALVVVAVWSASRGHGPPLSG